MNWFKTTVEGVCLNTQSVDPRKTPNKLFKYVDIASIDKEAKEITEASEILGENAPSRARKEIRAGDILVSTVRPNLNAVAVVPQTLDSQVASTGFCVLRPDPKLLVRDFLFYFSQTRNFINALCGKVRGAHYPAVSDSDVKSVAFHLPSRSEQAKIVEIINQADDLRRKRALSNSKISSILSSLYHRFIGNPANNPQGWPMAPLGEISLNGPQYGANAKAIPMQPGNPRYVRITDITEEGLLSDNDIVSLDLDSWDDYRLEDGDLLFARSGATVGKTFLYHSENGPCAFAGYLIRFQLNREMVHPWLAFAYSKTSHYRAWVQKKQRAAAQPNINGQEYSSIMLPIPDHHAQESFVRAAAEFFSIQKIAKVASAKICCLFSIILHSAFSGDMTSEWRIGHIKEISEEMKHQSVILRKMTS